MCHPPRGPDSAGLRALWGPRLAEVGHGRGYEHRPPGPIRAVPMSCSQCREQTLRGPTENPGITREEDLIVLVMPRDDHAICLLAVSESVLELNRVSRFHIRERELPYVSAMWVHRRSL